MKLISGIEPRERVELLFKLTSVRSAGKRKAILMHLSQGYPLEEASELCCVDLSNVKKTLQTLNECNQVVCDIEDIDFRHLKKKGLLK